MRKSHKGFSAIILILLITGCNSTGPNLNKINKSGTVILTFSELKELDKEYSGFKIKFLTMNYLKRKLEKWLSESGANLVKEINYALFKGESEIPFSALMASEPALYDAITANDSVKDEITWNIPFSNFINQSNPYPAVPANLSADNISLSGFTAHWDTVGGATSYDIVIDSLNAVSTGNNTSYDVTGLTGTSHSFKVRAIKNSITGSYSDPYNVTLLSLNANVLFVDKNAGGSNNGGSWADAFVNLQDALDNTSVSKNEIWIAGGTYLPTKPSDINEPRSKSFQLVTGVKIYGGFAGTESNLSERLLLPANETILSGDLNGDDIPNNPATKVDNAFSVVKSLNLPLASNTILDGVSIKYGNADTAFNNYSGGGIYNQNSSPILTNVTFSDNSAKYFGGGFYNQSGNPVFTNVTFSNNSATDGNGGGLLNEDTNAQPVLTNVTFSGNYAGNNGGGMHNYHSSSALEIMNVTFTGNYAGYSGGGMNNFYLSSPTLTNVTFYNNSAGINGGAVYDYLNSAPVLTNVTFAGNTAVAQGGNMYNESGSSPVIKNSIFLENTIVNSSSTLNISYSDIVGGITGIPGVNDLGSNIDAPPQFHNQANLSGADGIFRTTDDGLTLDSGSPALGSGESGADMGAYGPYTCTTVCP